MSNLAMEQAKTHIKAGNYDKARRVVDRYTSDEERTKLLKQIDVIEQRNGTPKQTSASIENKPKRKQKPKETAEKPISPGCLFWVSFVISPIVAMFGIAYNWRRLGRKSWMWVTLLTWLGVMGLGIAAAFSVGMLGLMGQLDTTLSLQLAIGIGVFALFCFAVVPYLLTYLQSLSYKVYQNDGLAAAWQYRYPMKSALVGFIVVAMIAGFGMVTWLFSEENTYSDGYVEITYPFGMANDENRPLDLYECSDIGDHCIVLIDDFFENFSIIIMDGLWVQDKADDLDSMSDLMWQFAHETKDNVPITRYELTINDSVGYDARAIEFTTEGWYIIHYFIEDRNGNQLFIMAEVQDEMTMHTNRATIDKVVNSIIFTP